MYHLSVYFPHFTDQYCSVIKNIDFPSLQTSVRNVIKIQCVKLSDKIDIACDYGVISSQLVRNAIKIQCVKLSDKIDIAYDYGIISSQLSLLPCLRKPEYSRILSTGKSFLKP